MENTDYMQNPEFRDWLRNIGFDDKVLQDEINNDDTSRLDDLIRRFEEKNRREEDDFAHFSQKPLSGNEPVNEDLDTYYKNWCEQEHQPPYVYENTNEQSPAYGMKYYKTEEDKTAGKPAARALYHDAKNVEVESTDDKGPDYEFLDALVRKAALDGQPGIIFEDGMTPEFANKLAAACVKYGLKMKGQPENIDVSEFADQLTPEQKTNIEKYNQGEKPYLTDYEKKLAITKDYAAHGTKEADISRHQDPAEQAAWFAAYKEAGIEPQKANPFYSLNKSKIRNLPESARKQLKGHNAETVGKLYEAAKAHAVADMAKNPTKEFDLRTSKAKDPKSAALLYAAYTAAGAKVVGMEEVNKDSQGMFQTETLGFMPEEAQKIVSDYNYGIRKEQLEAKRKEAEYAYRAAVMSPNPTAEQQEIIARHDERNAALTARGRIRLARQNGQEPAQEDRARVTGAGRQAALQEEIRRRQSNTH